MTKKDRLTLSLGRVVSAVREGNDKVCQVSLVGEETVRTVRCHCMSGDATAINLAIHQRNVETQKKIAFQIASGLNNGN